MGEHIVEKEMGFTHAEFERLLPKAFVNSDIQFEDRKILVRDGGRLLRIDLSAEGERRIGLFRIPVTHVRLTFSEYSKPEIEAALERFWRAFQKGGG